MRFGCGFRLSRNEKYRVASENTIKKMLKNHKFSLDFRLLSLVELPIKQVDVLEPVLEERQSCDYNFAPQH